MFLIPKAVSCRKPAKGLYPLLLTLSWPGGLEVLARGANIGFALLHLIRTNNIAKACSGTLGMLASSLVCEFSVQTMASIGYGAMYPLSLYANVLVTLEAMLGVAGTAVATGLFFFPDFAAYSLGDVQSGGGDLDSDALHRA